MPLSQQIYDLLSMEAAYIRQFLAYDSIIDLEKAQLARRKIDSLPWDLTELELVG